MNEDFNFFSKFPQVLANGVKNENISGKSVYDTQDYYIISSEKERDPRNEKLPTNKIEPIYFFDERIIIFQFMKSKNFPTIFPCYYCGKNKT